MYIKSRQRKVSYRSGDDLVAPSQERIARLEEKNAALQAEVAALRRRELTLICQEGTAQRCNLELFTLHQALQAEIRLRHQTETALQDSERRFQCTFEQSAVGMSLSSSDGRRLRVNQRFCDMVGYSEAELLALDCADITHPDTLAANLAARHRLISGEIPFYQNEKRYICKDGSLLWIDLSISTVRDDDGEPVYFIAMMQDISLRKEAELSAQKQQEAIQSSLDCLATEPELDKFLSQVLTTIVEQLHVPAVDVWLNDNLQGVAELYLSHWNAQFAPEPPDAFNPSPIPLSACQQGSAWDSICNQQQPFIYLDLPNHPDFDLYQDLGFWRDGTKTRLLSPLIFGDKYMGVLAITHFQIHPYSPEALHLVTALSKQVVLAIQLTRLAEDARQVAIMQERTHLAREIHDTLAQTFNGILLQLNNAQYYATQDSAIAWDIVKQVQALAQSGLAEARRSVWSLHPEADEYRDLAGSLRKSLIQLTRHTELPADFTVVGSSRNVPPDIGMNLLRIGQEAITNALRHAQAQTLQIELTFMVDAIALCIQDNGVGFALQQVRDFGGFGLLSIQQRCDRLGGQLMLRSQPGEGTCITVRVPLSLSS